MYLYFISAVTTIAMVFNIINQYLCSVYLQRPEKVEQELTAAENDGVVSFGLHKVLKYLSFPTNFIM